MITVVQWRGYIECNNMRCRHGSIIAGDGGCNNKPPSIAHQRATQLQTYNTCYARILSVKVAVAVMKDIGGRPRKLHGWGEMWRCGCRVHYGVWMLDAGHDYCHALSCISLHHLPRSSPAFLCITTTHRQMSL